MAILSGFLLSENAQRITENLFSVAIRISGILFHDIDLF